MKTIATEKGHWYTQTGDPFYEIECKSKPGEMRAVDLRDARKLNLFPSVTTILKVAAKPALDIWKQKQILLAALTLPRIEGETVDQFASRALTDAAHEAETKRNTGTAIHTAIEKEIAGLDYDKRYMPHVHAAMLAIDNFGKFSTEKSFASPLGYGGKVDLHNDNYVIDVKTTEFGPDDIKTLYDEHRMQLSAYMHGLKLKARMFILFVSISHPGLVRLVEHDEHNKSLKMFLCLLHYYQAKTGHIPEVENGK